jgi:hypothetical protein
MKTLEATINKNGYTYQLITRNPHAAMYRMVNPATGNTIAFEVGKVKIQKAGVIHGNAIEAGEVFWSNEDFGRIAWSIVNETEARELYADLTVKYAEKQTAQTVRP